MVIFLGKKRCGYIFNSYIFGRHILVVIFWSLYFGRHILVVIFWLLYFGRHILVVIFLVVILLELYFPRPYSKSFYVVETRITIDENQPPFPAVAQKEA